MKFLWPRNGFKVVVTAGAAVWASSAPAFSLDDSIREDLAISEAQGRQLMEHQKVVFLGPTASAMAMSNDRGVVAAVLIPAPVREVWDVIQDKEAATDYVGNLRRAEILEKEAGFMLVEQEMKIRHLPGTFTYVLKHEPKPFRSVTFELESGELREVNGGWQFIPVDGGQKTILVYALHLDPGFFVPQKMMDRGLRKSIPRTLKAVRARVKNLSEN